MLKTNDRKERRPNFAVSVVWRASYTPAKTLEREGTVSSCSFYGQLIHTLLALSTQWMSSSSRKQERGTQLTHLLPGGPRPVRIWLILDLVRNRCPNQKIRILQITASDEDINSLNGKKSQRGLNSLVSTLCSRSPVLASHSGLTSPMNLKHSGYVHFS